MSDFVTHERQDVLVSLTSQKKDMSGLQASEHNMHGITSNRPWLLEVSTLANIIVNSDKHCIVLLPRGSSKTHVKHLQLSYQVILPTNKSVPEYFLVSLASNSGTGIQQMQSFEPQDLQRGGISPLCPLTRPLRMGPLKCRQGGRGQSSKDMRRLGKMSEMFGESTHYILTHTSPRRWDIITL